MKRMKIGRVALAVAVAGGLSLYAGIAVSAALPTLTVTKACGSGVSGEANIIPSVSIDGVSHPLGSFGSGFGVACGQSTTIEESYSVGSSALAIPVGTVITLAEESAPTGAISIADVTVKTTGANQSIVIFNGARAGELSITKTCAAGVTGSAIFTVTVAPPAAAANAVNLAVTSAAGLPIPCGQTGKLSSAEAFAHVLYRGSTVTIKETKAATGGALASVHTAVLSADAQSVTIVDGKAAVATKTLAQTGGGSPAMPVTPAGAAIVLLLGAVTAGFGIRRLLVRR